MVSVYLCSLRFSIFHIAQVQVCPTQIRTDGQFLLKGGREQLSHQTDQGPFCHIVKRQRRDDARVR